MIRKILWMLLGLAIVVPVAGSLIAAKLHQFKTMGEAAAVMVVPAEPVNAVVVRQQDWQPRISAVGSVVAVQGTEVSAEAEGIVKEIKFNDGAQVKVGEVLLQLDTEVERAQLQESQAAADLSLLRFKRNQKLTESNAIAKEELDTSESNMKQALAKIENLKAVIDKKTVRAPFSGKVGIRRISVGAFIQKGTPIVSLQSLDPVHVEFSLPQQEIGRIAEGLKVIVNLDAYPGVNFEGKLTAINPDVDVRTRNVRVQATLPNPQGNLKPGMYVTADTILAKTDKVLFIPATAVVYAPYGDSVFVIEDNARKAGQTTGTVTAKANPTTSTLTVRQQFVRLGERHGDYVIAREGVKDGDQLVSTGVFKLKQGTAVVIDNTLAPKFSLNPNPDNT